MKDGIHALQNGIAKGVNTVADGASAFPELPNPSFTFYGFCEIWREMWIFAGNISFILYVYCEIWREMKIFEGI